MRRLMLTQSNALQLWGGWKQRPTLPLPLGGMAISISTRASRNIWSIDRVPWLVYGKLLKANSHRNAGRDKTVLSVSRPLRWWCELDSRQLATVGDRKFEVRTRSEQSSSDRQHQTRHRHDRFGLSGGRCELGIRNHWLECGTVRLAGSHWALSAFLVILLVCR